MKISELTKEDLEQMSYSELAELILTEKGSKLKIVDVFKKICKVLNLPESVFENKVADFFELITNDKKFIVLDKGYCDLSSKYTPDVIIEEEEEDLSEVDPTSLEESDEIENEDEDTEEDIFYDSSSSDDDVDDDDLADYMVIDGEDEEETSM